MRDIRTVLAALVLSLGLHGGVALALRGLGFHPGSPESLPPLYVDLVEPVVATPAAPSLRARAVPPPRPARPRRAEPPSVAASIATSPAGPAGEPADAAASPAVVPEARGEVAEPSGPAPPPGPPVPLTLPVPPALPVPPVPLGGAPPPPASPPAPTTVPILPPPATASLPLAPPPLEPRWETGSAGRAPSTRTAAPLARSPGVAAELGREVSAGPASPGSIPGTGAVAPSGRAGGATETAPVNRGGDATPAAGGAPAAGGSSGRVGGGAGAAGPVAALTGGRPGAIPPEYDAYVRALRRRIEERLAYPALAVRRGVQGTVELELELDPAGRLTAVVEVGREGGGLLREAAIRAVRDATPFPFPPGLAARALTIRLPIVFELQQR